MCLWKDFPSEDLQVWFKDKSERKLWGKETEVGQKETMTLVAGQISKILSKFA